VSGLRKDSIRGLYPLLAHYSIELLSFMLDCSESVCSVDDACVSEACREEEVNRIFYIEILPCVILLWIPEMAMGMHRFDEIARHGPDIPA
jgi:hypothetical protein